MKKIILLSFFVALMLGACTVEKRVVTAKHWANPALYYVAYFEWEETYFPVLGFTWFHNDWSKIKRCNVRDDNTLACLDEQEAQMILNPQHTGEVDRTSGAPAEATPAEATPTEATPTEATPAEAPAEEKPAE